MRIQVGIEKQLAAEGFRTGLSNRPFLSSLFALMGLRRLSNKLRPGIVFAKAGQVLL
jgi:hypothetical protein